MGQLTDVQIRNWIKAGSAIAKADGDGLTFTLSAKGTAAWVLRYRVPGAKSQKEMTLGRYPDITLGKARELATEARAKVQQGADVAREKQATKRESASAWTVRQLADDYMQKSEAHLAQGTIDQRRQQLGAHVFPIIGSLAAKDVTPADVVTITERAAAKSLHVARLVLIALRGVFAHGVARHVVKSNPCIDVKAKAVIGPRPVRRTRLMLTEPELRAMLPALPDQGRQNELALKILLATCTRIGELTRAEWSHIDFERREWAIPAEHAKNKKRFVIPLPDVAVGWFVELQQLAFGSRFVLPVRSRRDEGDKHMESSTLNVACNRIHAALKDKETGRETCRRFTPHDLRSTARSHLSALGVDIIVAERCLNHSLGGLVAVYDQHDYLTERRAALDTWCSFLQACELGKDWNVVPMRKAAA